MWNSCKFDVFYSNMNITLLFRDMYITAVHPLKQWQKKPLHAQIVSLGVHNIIYGLFFQYQFQKFSSYFIILCLDSFVTFKAIGL